MRAYTTQEVRRICVALRRLGYDEPGIMNILILWRIKTRVHGEWGKI